MKKITGTFLVVFLFILSICMPVFGETASDVQMTDPDAQTSDIGTQAADTGSQATDTGTQTTGTDSQTTGTASKVVETGIYRTDKVLFDGKQVELKAIVYKDRIYVKLRELCYYLKCDVQVDNEQKIINLLENPESSQKLVDDGTKSKSPVKINLNISGYNIKIDGINTYIKSFIHEDRTYVPIRYFSEFFDRKTDWLEGKKQVSINKMVNDVIGTVNGQPLYQNDFDYIYNPQYYELKKSSSQENFDSDAEKLKADSFDDLVLMNILMQKVAKNNYALNESDFQQINTRLDSVVNSYGGIEKLRESMTENGVTLKQFETYVKNSYMINILALDLVKNVTASDEKLKKYYEDNKSMFLEPEKVRAKHILFLTSDQNTGTEFDAQKKEEIKKRAEEVLASIKAGANFDELMNKYTEDPGIESYPDGYTFGKGEMVKAFEDTAFALNVGEVSDLVETEYGYHIIKLEEKIPEKQLTFDEVKDSYKGTLDDEEKNLFLTKLVDQWKAESKIENKMK